MRHNYSNTNQTVMDFLKPVFDELLHEIDNNIGQKQNHIKANILETDSSFEIQLAALGHTKESVKIHIEDNVLKVEGHSEPIEGIYKLKEFTTQSFKRNFNLPKNINKEQVKAKFNNGILYITLAKSTPSSVKVDIL